MFTKYLIYYLNTISWSKLENDNKLNIWIVFLCIKYTDIINKNLLLIS